MADLISPRCPTCGADATLNPQAGTATCKYCNTTSVIEQKPVAGPPRGADYSAFGQGPRPPMGPPPMMPPPMYPAPGYAQQGASANAARTVVLIIVALVAVPILLAVVGMVVAIVAARGTPAPPRATPVVAPPPLPTSEIRPTAEGQRTACESEKSGVNCFELGLRYEKGNGVTKDNRRAVEYYEKGCTLDHDGACTNYGLAFSRGTGVAKDPAKYIEYSTKGCELGSAVGCNNVGWAYQSGEGVAPDIKKAIEYYDDACTRGSHFGCYNLAFTAKDNPKLRNKPEKIASLFKGACEQKHGGACFGLAELYAKGAKGFKKDPAKAKRYYGEACSNGFNDGCGK